MINSNNCKTESRNKSHREVYWTTSSNRLFPHHTLLRMKQKQATCRKHKDNIVVYIRKWIRKFLSLKTSELYSSRIRRSRTPSIISEDHYEAEVELASTSVSSFTTAVACGGAGSATDCSFNYWGMRQVSWVLWRRHNLLPDPLQLWRLLSHLARPLLPILVKDSSDTDDD